MESVQHHSSNWVLGLLQIYTDETVAKFKTSTILANTILMILLKRTPFCGRRLIYDGHKFLEFQPLSNLDGEDIEVDGPAHKSESKAHLSIQDNASRD